MAGYERNNVLPGVNLFITLMFLLLSQQHFLCATDTNRGIADIQEQSRQAGKMAKELVRYAKLYRSSDKPFGDLSLIISSFADIRSNAMPASSVDDSVIASRVSKKADEQQQDNEQKLISWIRKHRLQPLMQEQRQGEDQHEALNTGTDGQVENGEVGTSGAVSRKSKRKINCKPLKEQFMELQGEVKKGDNSFKNNLRDFFANCQTNDSIRF